MSRKKVFLLFISLVLILGLLPNFVSAQEDRGGVGEGLGSAFETIRNLFSFLPELVTLEKLIGQEPAAIFWAKFLVWLFLFAVVFFGAGFVFKDNKNISIVVAIVISLMGALLIPNEILVNIFQTYGLVSAILIWALPVTIGMYIAHKVQNRFVRALIYGISGFVLFNINKTIVEQNKMMTTSFPYFSLLFAVVVILFFWNLFGIFGGGQGQHAVGGWFGDRARGFGDWATTRGPERGPRLPGGGGPEPKPPSDVKKEEEKEKAEEEQIKKLEGVRGKLQAAQDRLDAQIINAEHREVQHLIVIAGLIGELIEIEEEVRRITGR